MKRLFRGEAPPCLAKLKHGKDNWSVISKNCLGREIWEKLDEMQNGFCAYCECRLNINNSNGHIEHFIQRNRNQSLTFDWNNIFGSCNNQNSCGRYKDNNPLAKKIDLNKVCKPDVIDPSTIMLFLDSGEIRPRANLDIQQEEIAKNTIAIFNLNDDTKLVNARRIAITAEKSLADNYWEMLVKDDDSLAELLEEELNEALQRISSEEYSTALKHLWNYNEQF